ncbi:MAG: PQQ-dependent sugar dehydrogenase [Planctomycetes bacterium]|nr:PQQ-dependent sugar dehydrogenase [Planctomycetota bacterium]
MMSTRAALCISAVVLFGSATTTQATFHFMKIEQVIGGVNGDTTAQAIQLQMRSGFQNFIAPSRIRAWDAAGMNPIVIVDFGSTVPNGTAGSRVLIASANFANHTSPPLTVHATEPTMTNLIPASYLAAGSLTFETDSGGIIYWRLSWGGASYTGSTTGSITNDDDGDFGPPFAGPLPSSTTQALLFKNAAGVGSTTNAADYALTAGAAIFTNNAGDAFTVQEGAETTGACCDDLTGICTDSRTSDACTGDGFRYGGDDSTCATIDPPCAGPAGACCDENTGDCTEGETQADCEGAGARYGGDGSTCATIDPSCEAPPLEIGLELVAEGLVSPLSVTHAGDGSGRLFIVDQVGLIRVVENGVLLATPFLDVSAKMPVLGEVFDERGLLGMTFHPDYASNGRFFIRYSAPRSSTGSEPCDVTTFNPGCHAAIVAEYHVAGDPTTNNVADATSEIILLTVAEPQFNHNGGDLAFGPDGLLYVALGDGGGANDGLADIPVTHGEFGNGQNIETLLGAMLRIDVDGTPDMGLAYKIPLDNPFVGMTGADEIYAYGFRNPYRFSFDDGPGGDGSIYLGDVGQDVFEEVDIVDQGGNYGWVLREGAHCFDPFNPKTPPVECETAGLIDPVSEYTQAEGGLSVIGGFVYRGAESTRLVGKYIFGDFSADFGPTGRIYYFDTTGPEAFVRKEFAIAPDDAPLGLVLKGFGEDADGEVYACTSLDLPPSGSSGAVYRIVGIPDTPQTEPDGVPKNRFISFALPAGGAGAETAIEVQLLTLNRRCSQAFSTSSSPARKTRSAPAASATSRSPRKKALFVTSTCTRFVTARSTGA